MIHYKDKTFCAHSCVCANYECNRWVNFEKVKDSGMPVALADFKSDDCGYKPNPVWANLRKKARGEAE